MKKGLAYLMIVVFIISFSSCSQSRNISSYKIITACFAEKGSQATRYSFYISNPSPSNDEHGNESDEGKLCHIEASNFKSAIAKLEENIGKCELSHISTFFVDSGYLSERYFEDSKIITEYIRVSPTISFFVMGSSSQSVFECFNNSYGGSPKKYIESAWRGNRKNILCTMPEMIYASENPLYTASVPVLEISPDQESFFCNAGVFYNVNKGIMSVTDEDYKLYSNHLKKYGKTSKPFDVSLSEKGLNVTFDKNVDSKDEMLKFSQKYTSVGFDFLNIFYYSKKCFPDYHSYYKYIENKDHNNISFG